MAVSTIAVIINKKSIKKTNIAGAMVEIFTWFRFL
jgi:hypothetical protein